MSVSDVYEGYLPALQDLGVDIWKYNMDQRINESGAWFHFLHKRRRKFDPDFPKRAQPGVVLAHAAQDVLARALWNDIDWVVIVSGLYFHPDMAILLRKAGRKVAVLLTESPYDDDKQGQFIAHANLAWTNERTSAAYLQQWNPHVAYLPHAYNTEKVGHGLNPHVPQHEVLFIGTGFKERIEMLEAVDWTGIDLALYGSWDLLGSRHRLRKYIKGGYVDNVVAQQMYQNAAINLNLYRTSKGFGRDTERVLDAESLNPRALELAAGGCFTLSDFRPEVAEVFGDAVPTFTTPAELEGLVRLYLAHPQERRQKAAALPGLVEGFTFQERAKQLLRDLERYDQSPALV
jgi:spore maturation protein CgeB